MKEKEYPFLSIVIVNLDGEKWLKKCIPSVLNSDYPFFETIVVDNGSIDGSVKYLKEDYPQIKVVELEKNIGWSPANNEGTKIAKGDIIVYLSNDMEVDSHWLKEIVKVMKLYPKIGVVQCNSISMWDRKTLDSCMNYLDRFGYSYGYAPSSQPQEVFFAEGMAFAVKRVVIEDIGMLDDYYFMEYDDMDFCWRARLAGYKVYFAPSAIVYHARGGTVGKIYFKRVKNVEWYTRNHIVTLIKNYENKNLIKILPTVILIELSKITYLLIIKRNKKVAFAAARGLFQVLKDLKHIMQKRKEVQKIRQVSDKEVMKHMHNFEPKLLYSFIVSQSTGKRFVINDNPPVIRRTSNEKD